MSDCSCGYEASSDPRAYAQEVCGALMKTDFEAMYKIATRLLAAKSAGRTIFTAGNGGSAATASHIINDLTKGCRVGHREGFRTVCLDDSSVLVTCLANDFCYEDVYRILLKTLAQPNDVLIVFSGSGNSPNIVRACEMAREMGVFVIGFGGRDGGRMKPLCDICLMAPTYSMEQLEDLHVIYLHSLVCTLKTQLQQAWDITVIRFPRPGAAIIWDATASQTHGAAELHAALEFHHAVWAKTPAKDFIAFAATPEQAMAFRSANCFVVGIASEEAAVEALLAAEVDCVVPDFTETRRLADFLCRMS